jgi:hypothetical protein
MTKSDKLKLGVAGGLGLVAVIVLVWYFFLSSPPADKPQPLPEGAPVPTRGVPTGP